MQVKNALTDKAQQTIDFLKAQIAQLELMNDGLNNMPESWLFNRAAARAGNDQAIANFRDEIIELEDLRDGYITVDQLGTARRFFNKMPAWGTYGT